MASGSSNSSGASLDANQGSESPPGRQTSTGLQYVDPRWLSNQHLDGNPGVYNTAVGDQYHHHQGPPYFAPDHTTTSSDIPRPQEYPTYYPPGQGAFYDPGQDPASFFAFGHNGPSDAAGNVQPHNYMTGELLPTPYHQPAGAPQYLQPPTNQSVQPQDYYSEGLYLPPPAWPYEGVGLGSDLDLGLDVGMGLDVNALPPYDETLPIPPPLSTFILPPPTAGWVSTYAGPSCTSCRNGYTPNPPTSLFCSLCRYGCDFPGCGRRFDSVQSIRRHLRHDHGVNMPRPGPSE